MTENTEKATAAKPLSDTPILQLYRLTYVKVGGKILDSTDAKLAKYIRFAALHMGTEITSGDVIEYALKMLFDRDAGFKNWLKTN